MSGIQGYEAQAAQMREGIAARMPGEALEALQSLIADVERDVVSKAVDTGEQAPDFTLHQTDTNDERGLAAALANGPVVLSFYRGQWWPYCNLEVQGLQSIYDDVKALGGEIFLIGPETDETAMQLMEKTKSTIPILNDVDGSVIESYRLAFELSPFFQEVYPQWGMDLPKSNPDTGWMLPVPATYVVGTDGVVTARYVNADYTYRMEPADVLAAVQAAAQ